MKIFIVAPKTITKHRASESSFRYDLAFWNFFPKRIFLNFFPFITQFKEICEEKSINASNDYNDELKKQNRESKEVFNYLRNFEYFFNINIFFL